LNLKATKGGGDGVIASAAKQSMRSVSRALDCFAALAMTLEQSVREIVETVTEPRGTPSHVGVFAPVPALCGIMPIRFQLASQP
jgi:hypothetical protein